MWLKATLGSSVAAALFVSCSVQPAPVPVEGPPNDLMLLAGEWTGSYASDESGRSGEIFFELGAEADSATGYVLMEAASKPQIVGYKSSRGFGTESASSSASRLTIRFVRAEAGNVRGTLNRYPDPDCGCTLHTTFLGRIEGDSIKGTFETLHIDSGTTQNGTWQVSRRN
jgi:hypothetical protein